MFKKYCGSVSLHTQENSQHGRLVDIPKQEKAG